MILHGEAILSGGQAPVTVDAGGRSYVITGLAADADENVWWEDKTDDGFTIRSSNGASVAAVGWKVRLTGIRLRAVTITPDPELARLIVANAPIIALTRRFGIVGIAYETQDRHMRITAEELTVEPIVVTEEEA